MTLPPKLLQQVFMGLGLCSTSQRLAGALCPPRSPPLLPQQDWGQEREGYVPVGGPWSPWLWGLVLQFTGGGAWPPDVTGPVQTGQRQA